MDVRPFPRSLLAAVVEAAVETAIMFRIPTSGCGVTA